MQQNHKRNLPTYFLFCCLSLLFWVGCNQAEGEPIQLIVESASGENEHPTLADFWEGRAEFVTDVEDTGLPMGESETFIMNDGVYWSYVHASDQSAGIIDQCGDPVPFPGCTVIYQSSDNGM